MIVIFIALKDVKGLQNMPYGIGAAIKLPQAANDE